MNLLGTTVLLISVAGLSAAAVRADAVATTTDVVENSVSAVGNNEERDLSADRQAELVHLLKHDCGACHGMFLAGGLGPPLRPSDLAAKSESALVSAVLAGRAGTPMPPWRGLLTGQEARWLVRYLRGAMQ